MTIEGGYPTPELIHRVTAEQTFPRDRMVSAGLVLEGTFTDIQTWPTINKDNEIVDIDVIPVLGFTPDLEGPETILYPADINKGKEIILMHNTQNVA